MSFFEFPHTRTYDSDLGWLIKRVKRVCEDMENFVNLNKIKYADPIEWSITEQYEGNTVVIDPLTGNAYISTKPVPGGVKISNTEYWTPIFNYDETINKLREEIVADNEGDNEFAEETKEAGALLWWNGTLYRVTETIPPGTRFLPGVNIESVTVEELLEETEETVADKLEAESEARTSAYYGENIFNTGAAAEIMENNETNDIIRALTFNITTQSFLNAIVFNVSTFDRAPYIKMLSMIENSGAQVVGLQEQYMPTNYNIEDFYCDEVYKDANFTSNFEPSLIAANGMYGARYGNGIVTTMQQENYGTTLYNNQAVGDNPRAYNTASIVYAGHSVKIYVTHITYLDLETKLAELNELFSALVNDESPYIICMGDFNLDYPFLTEKFAGSGFTVQNTMFNTFPASAPTASLDNIITKGFDVVNVGTMESIDTQLFDHLGLYADLKFI